MVTIRQFSVTDLYNFNNINLDPLTETYGLDFYLDYISKWPELFQVVENSNGKLMGYIMGKTEGNNKNWHGHVTALTVAPEYRRMGIARALMKGLEDISDSKKCFFVDLYVRESNHLAISMYERMGYIVYRRVIDYYSSSIAKPTAPIDDGDEDGGGRDGAPPAALAEPQDEDGLDMRKSLSSDPRRESMVPLSQPVNVYELYE